VSAEGRAGRPSKKKAGALGAGTPKPLTRQLIEEWALSYVNRFDCTASKLSRHLTTRARKHGWIDSAPTFIDELVTRYQGSGVLDDERFARNLTAQLAARGKSSRAISQRLAARGVTSEVSQALLAARRHDEPSAELEAARAYARKRRLGVHRPADVRDEHRRKDLATLARQGFSFEIARQALGPGSSTDDEL
jgi:regulatory protein